MKMKLFAVVVLLASFTACRAQVNYEMLEGTWKIEGKEKYEVWEKANGTLKGESYSVKDGIRRTTETLEIKEENGNVVYRATVPNQNNGATIPFTLNVDKAGILSFENPEHDFPTQIIYEPVSDSRVLVKVLGSDGKGFSYYMDKQ
ncbi:DUF6265 family protein [Fulvivirga lutimaris]|uniref:DUF6265 family protein n=1 Tax=Fulvivirga lutimaris TaxID=1819566 RepID=UPI0012BC1B13|nr:DUF6265 family protein [Fulvivirga lutimaris]MTI39207.1 hypothetical protein [Fulvivirga lutimaris]